MERSRNSSAKRNLLMLLLLISQAINAQTAEIWSCRLQQLYTQGLQEKWPELISQMALVKERDVDLEMILASARYGYIGMLLGRKQKTEAKKELTILTKELEVLQKQYPTSTRVMSMRAGLVGYSIAINPLKAPFLGPESGRLLDASAALNPNCPYVLTEQGNSLFFRPALFGGDKNKALDLWQKASQIFARQGNTCNWYAVHVRVMVVKALRDLGLNSEAETQAAALKQEFVEMEWLK